MIIICIYFSGAFEIFNYNFASSETEMNEPEFEQIAYQGKNHNCPHCSFSSKKLAKLSQHLLLHSVDKPFVCSMCPKTFRLKHHVSEHMRTHTGDKRYKCVKCDQSYTKKVFLVNHYEKCH